MPKNVRAVSLRFSHGAGLEHRLERICRDKMLENVMWHAPCLCWTR
jgi:hypothetical protein